MIIRRDNIGDLVCTTPLISALRRERPRCYIAALVNDYNAPILADNPHLDAVFVYAKAKHRSSLAGRISAYLGRARLLIKLFRLRFDYAILASDKFEKYALRTARLAGARVTIGYSSGHPEQDPDLSIPTRAPVEHEVIAVCRLLEPLGINAQPGSMVLIPKEAEQAAIRGRLSQLFDVTKPIIAFHISAREPTRIWPIARYGELISRLKILDANFLILWSPGPADNPYHPGDDDSAAALLAQFPRGRVVGLPTINLPQLIAAVSLCRMMVCSDGGSLHVAAAMSIPVVGLFENRPDKLGRWYPWGVDHIVVPSQKMAVSDIEVQAVFEACCALARRLPSVQSILPANRAA